MRGKQVGLGMVCLFMGMAIITWAQSAIEYNRAWGYVHEFKAAQARSNEITMEEFLASLKPEVRKLFEKMMQDYLAVRRNECQRGLVHVPPKDLAYNDDWKGISMTSRQFLEKSFDTRFKVLGGCSWILSIK